MPKNNLFRNAVATATGAFCTLAAVAVFDAQAAGPAPQPGPPIAYGQWNVTNGVIDTSPGCSGGGVSCSNIASDNGFQYEILNTPLGQFARMILTEAGANGTEADQTFSTETFTPMMMRAASSGDFLFSDGSTIAQGIASRQVIRDPSGQLESTAEIQRGFARKVVFDFAGPPSDPQNTPPPGSTPAPLTDEEYRKAWSTKLTQVVKEDSSTTKLVSGFSAVTYTEVTQFPANEINTDIVRGRLIDVWQGITDKSTGQTQKLDYRVREGNTGWTFFCSELWGPQCPPPVTNGGSIQLDSTLVAWNAGDRVAATWLGSDLGAVLGTTTVTANGVTGRVQSFGDPQPVNWPSDPAADLNWPVAGLADPGLPDAPRSEVPVIP